MKIKSAVFNDDTNDIEVEIYFDDDKTTTPIKLYTPDIEDSFTASPYVRSQLILLAEKSPTEYAELVLTGKMQNFINLCATENKSTSDIIREQYKKHYPDMSDAQIDSLIQEHNMYDS